MRTLHLVNFGLLVAIAISLGGCVSPTIVLQPKVPAVESSSGPGSSGAVSLVADRSAMNPQLSKFEEKGDKTLIGKSESLGVHLSDIWMEEPPAMFVRRLLQEDLKAWGYTVSSGKEPIQLNAQVNKFSLDSRAISAVEFQADGAIDVTVTVSRADGTEVYKGRYVGTCTRKTASEFPTSEYLEKVFGQCIDEYEKQVRSDGRLRAALSPT